MKITFVSNYINHHQIPFCNAMERLALRSGGSFLFVQTEPMEEERVRMGWQPDERPEYVRCYYEEETVCRGLILDSDVVIFGGCDEEAYIEERLRQGKLILRYSERLYKTGQWKMITPRGLVKKYKDHTRYRKAPVYLLCAGAYVPSDFHLVRAYPGKMFCWGYFPETRTYDVERLMERKGYGEARLPYFLWAGRMIDWKHPELAIETAAYLKRRGIRFHMDVIGGGDMEEQVRALWKRYQLEGQVSFLGFQPPARVREYMERADIYLFTSDRQEGWGAVANEAMNSGCALIADHMIGAVPYLIRPRENGLIYPDKRPEELFRQAEELARDDALRKKLGTAAYHTISEDWNAERAAERLMELCKALQKAGGADRRAAAEPGERLLPCAPAPVIAERRMLSFLYRKEKEKGKRNKEK